jgi:shikimate dehydrogenase
MLRLVLLGDPVAHSLSPQVHTTALEAVGLDGTYTARRVDSEGFVAALEELRGGRLDGANITMPHKGLAAGAADLLSSDAGRAQSVNTLVRREGRIMGESTDVDGIRRAWGDLPEAPVVILGTGGAAAAALLALEGRPLRVAGRRPEAAVELIERVGVDARPVEWSEPVEGMVVVNATPIGMRGESLPDRLLAGARGLFDMPYATGQTPAVAAARSAGIPVVEGVEMLLHQAALSFRIWTGVDAPIEAMRAAVGPPPGAVKL